MLKWLTEGYWDTKATIRVNTVNCVGVMGKGITLEFKNRYPEMFSDYQKWCKNGIVRPGRVIPWHDQEHDVIVLNAVTQGHWKNPSKIIYIKTVLENIYAFLGSQRDDHIITLPALGCGNGGLDWDVVKGLIKQHLTFMPQIIYVFEPKCN